MKTICHHIQDMRFRPTNRPAMRFKYRRKWRELTWNDYYDKVKSVSEALTTMGLKKGDRVAIMSNSRPEWCFLDLATMALGGAVVPIYHNVTNEDFTYILNDSECRFVFVESDSNMQQWTEIQNDCPKVEKVIAIGRKTVCPEGTLPWKDFEQQAVPFEENDHFQKLCLSVTPDDIATILYTSGTTGTPKGVIISHTQISSEIEDTFEKLGVTANDSCLTFLPYAHILGRIEPWGQIYMGFTLNFAENMEKIRDNLKEIRPTIMVAVPRVFEKIYNSIRAQAENTYASRYTSKWAYKIGHKVSQMRQNKETISAPLYAEYLAAKKLVFDRIRNELGGKLRFAISGGAPLNPDIAQFFHAADILILEGYGLTETTAAITVNMPWDFKFGTVGKPVGDVEIKIAEDGEILVRSKKVMKGYLNDADSTKKALADGWLHTGDIGEFDEDGFLKITDRKKDLIKTAGGKYIAPQKLESMLKKNPLISNVLIHGDKRKHVVALVTLDLESSRRYALQNGIDFIDVQGLSQSRELHKCLQQAIADVNSQLASYETIKNFAVLPNDFTVEEGELTPSMKIRRKFLDKKYTSVLDDLY